MRNSSSSGGRDAAYLATMERLRARIAQNSGGRRSANADRGGGADQNLGRRGGEADGVGEPFDRRAGEPLGRDASGGRLGGRFAAESDSASSAAMDSRVQRIVAGLNPQQLEAVTHSGAPLLVVAGAGSGKTRVLTSRIGYLIASGRAAPGQILAITFTNKAAKEMRERLESALGGSAIRTMWVSTFHSACVRILRSEHDALGMRSTFTIYDAQDAQRLMKLVCREENIDIRAHPPKSLSRRVSDLKNDLVTPEQAADDAADQDSQVLAHAYAAYQIRLRQANAMDFDDLIMSTVDVLRSHPDVADHYRRRFRHILVDEYQDTNRAQYELVRALTGTAEDDNHGELTVVGDADQSIYAFRGATIRNIEDFEKDFPEARTILLEQNYRSTQSILSAANGIIANNSGRRPKRLWTDRGDGEKIVGYVADSEADESAFVVSEIDRLRDDAGISYGDVAVFYRTNAQSRAVEDMFVRSGIPYRVIGGTRFYERREIKDALAYLHAIVNRDDTVSIRRILNMPKRGLGAKSEEAVAMHAARWDVSFGAALCDVGDPHPERGPVSGIGKKASATMAGFVSMLQSGRGMAEAGAAPDAILDFAMEESGYLDMLRSSDDPQDESRLENLAELHSVAVDFHKANPDATLADWLDQVSLVSDADQLADGDEGEVTLMTVHTAKGLEFPVVFVTGLEDGTFPHMRSLIDPAELAEERRLAYVAVTRARQRLYITRAAARASWGAPQEFPPSRFIEEIPDSLIDWRRSESSADAMRRTGGRTGTRGSGGRRRSESFGGGYGDELDDGPVVGSGKGFVPGKLGVDAAKQKRRGKQAGAARGANRSGAANASAGVGESVSDAAAGSPGLGAADGAGPNAGPSAPDTYGLAVGDSVVHKSFGRGKIVAFEGTGRNTTARVTFSSGQTKRLALRFAPLEKI